MGEGSVEGGKRASGKERAGGGGAVHISVAPVVRAVESGPKF